MVVKNLSAMQETPVQSLGREDSLEKGMATHFKRIPWTEEPGGLQSMELQRAGHDWGTVTSLRIVPWSSMGCLPIQMYIVNDRCGRRCRHTVYKVTVGWLCLLRPVLFIYLIIGHTACGILVPRPGSFWDLWNTKHFYTLERVKVLDLDPASYLTRGPWESYLTSWVWVYPEKDE